MNSYQTQEVNNTDRILQRTEHQYDTANRIKKQTWQLRDSSGGYDTFTETYNYRSSDGLLSDVVLSARGALDYGINYDALKRVSKFYNWNNHKTYTYKTLPNGNASTLVNSIAYTKQNGASFSDFTLTYGYDTAGNITSVTGSGISTQNASYVYDNQGQMTKATIGGTVYDYSYDTYGNILGVTGGANHTYTYGNANWKDLLTAFDNQPITYDEIGNPTSYYNGQRWTMEWTHGRQLKSASVSGGTSVSYSYDADGIRTSKTVGTTTYNYITQNGKVVRQTWGSNYMDFFYDYNGNPYACYHNGTRYYYILNQQGDVIRMVDVNGATAAEYQYDAWGNLVQWSGTMWDTNPLRFKGYYYDNETGFYYVSSRYYDPAIGRFINADDPSYLAANGDFISYNLFTYCGNNPINRRDVGGNAWETVFDLVSLGTSIIEVAGNPGDLGAWIGLAGDIIDVAVPFVAGVGETVRVINGGRKLADAADDLHDATRAASKIHANSLKSNRMHYGYQLIDKDKNVLKYGESKNPLTRYSKKWLEKNKYEVQIKVAGTKRGVHEWQHDMIKNYAIISGARPELNKSLW